MSQSKMYDTMMGALQHDNGNLDENGVSKEVKRAQDVHSKDL